MKRIVWIAALILAVSGVAYGMRSDLPEGDTTATSGAELTPVVDEDVVIEDPAEVEPAPEDPMIGETPGRSRSSRRTMGMPGETGPRTAPTTRRGGGFGMPATLTVAPTEVRRGSKFKLFGIRSQATYGPFEFREGGRISLGAEEYVIQPLEAGVEGVKRTDEQIRLEGKLRRATVPDIAFEEAGLMEVVDFLSREAEVNIVVTKPVQEAKVTITLRLRNVPLYDAIRYVTEVVGLWFRIDDHAVVIMDTPVPRGGEIPPQLQGR